MTNKSLTTKQKAEAAPSRRAFLRGAAGVAGAAAAGVAGAAALPKPAKAAVDKSLLPPNIPPWSQELGEGVTARPYGTPSQHEKEVIRRTVPWLTATAESSISFTPIADLHGIITPNGLHFERHHGGFPDIQPDAFRLIMHGMLEEERMYTLKDIMRFPSVSRIHFVECPANSGMEWRGAQMEKAQFTHGMVSCCQWTGVLVKTLIEELGLKDKCKWVLAEGADAAGMSRSIPIEKMMDDAIIAYAQNGEMLRPEQGYPLRLITPGFEGNMNVKWLRRLEFGDQPWHHREETSKYTDLMPDGRARRFTWFMETKSVITAPCPEKPLENKGFCEIRGLAWSGTGAIKKVDVSVDGGRNWREAKLDGPILPKALTRFTLPWEWDGSEKLLMSRAMDDTGYVQPTISQLREVRGNWSIYHNNSIHSWLVNKNGEVENVQVG
ncbi:MAG: sulfite dehydrogenase [Magnetovibrionaceae bacterium]